MQPTSEQRRGYLHEDFRIFHLKDAEATRVDYHYHEFDKLVILLSGSVTYFIEDLSYTLRPGDLLFVPHSKIHKPLISSSEVYERYVIWMTPDFLRRCSRHGADLSLVFSHPAQPGDHLLSLSLPARLDLLRQLTHIQESMLTAEYGSDLLTENLFSIFMLTICRLYLQNHRAPLSPVRNAKISEICSYIDKHLGDDLTVEQLSTLFYTSRYHLMRTFKAQTGYTLHQYITRRRILHAGELIGGGMPVAKAALLCGYEDYSAFLRAFKSIFKTTPKSFTSMGRTTDIEQE